MDQNFAVNCGFFNSINKDRLYVAEQMNKPYHRLVSNGVFATPKGTPSTDLQVLSENSGRKVRIKKGAGIFGDKWFESPSDIVLTVPANATMLPRRDSVIAQVNRRDDGRVGRLIYRDGTAASNPMPPNLSTDPDVKEYRIANIYVASGAAAINQDAITDLRGSSECPWVTHLLYQVDTSTLFLQYQEAYQNYVNKKTADFDAWQAGEKLSFEQWLATLTGQLTVATSVIKYESRFTTSANLTTSVPINIASFDKDKDVLLVRINNLFAVLDLDYTISDDSQSIELVRDLEAGQRVDFIVLQSVIIGDTTSAMAAISQINAKVSELNTGSSWTTFTLEGGAVYFDTSTRPACRKIGSQVFIRGAIKGVNTINTAVCTLPTTMRPANTHVFAANAYNGTTVVPCVIEVTTGGVVRIAAKGADIPADAKLSIATSFVVG